jgi:hypothetical protein
MKLTKTHVNVGLFIGHLVFFLIIILLTKSLSFWTRAAVLSCAWGANLCTMFRGMIEASMDEKQ